MIIRDYIKKLFAPRILLRLLGIAIFIVLLSMIDLNKLWILVIKIKPNIIVPLIFLVFLILVTKALRWQFILRRQNIHISFQEALLFYLSSVYMGMITPGRLGEFGKVFYIRDKGHAYGKLFFGVFLERIFDLLILSYLAVYGMFSFYKIFSENLWGLFILLVLVLIIIVVFYYLNNAYNLLLNIIPSKFRSRIIENWNIFKSEFNTIGVWSYLVIFFLSISGWVIFYGVLFMLTRSMEININFLQVIFFASISAFIAMLPISYAGIGTRDVALIYLFGAIGLDKELAIAFSSIFLLIYLFILSTSAISWFLSTSYLSKALAK